MSIELLTIIMFGGLLLLLILGLPISFAMGGIAAVVTYVLWGIKGLMPLVYNVFGEMWKITYISIPLFIFMGVMLERSGIADDLFEVFHRWSGQLRGGLAMGTVVICAIFAAMTGVTAAATTTMGIIAVPAMLKRRYDKSLALGTVAAAGTLGILIPPSIIMVVLAVTSETSVGKLFMAGFIPGLLLILLFILYIGIRGLIQPQLCPPHHEKFTMRQKLIATKGLILPIFIIVSVLGGIFFGLATPTEASALGAMGVIIATAIRRRLTWQVTKGSAFTTFGITGMVMWIGFAAMCFSRTYSGAGGILFFNEVIMSLEVTPLFIVISIMLLVFFLGMFLAPFAIIFIVAPIAYPVIEALGFDPIWFGLLFVINMQMAYITPPFGFDLFYLKAVAPPNISMGDIYRSIFPFLMILILAMALVIIFPQIALWLPETMIKMGA